MRKLKQIGRGLQSLAAYFADAFALEWARIEEPQAPRPAEAVCQDEPVIGEAPVTDTDLVVVRTLLAPSSPRPIAKAVHSDSGEEVLYYGPVPEPRPAEPPGIYGELIWEPTERWIP